MNKIIKLLIVLSIGFALGAGYAADTGSIGIITPSDGAVLRGDAITKLIYQVKLSPRGNHLHIYIDDQKPIVDRGVVGCPCAVDLPQLSPGKHVIVIKEA